MREGGHRSPAWLQVAVLVPANLVGALVSFTYFTFVDFLTPPRTDGLAGAIRFFIVGFALLVAIAAIWTTRWTRILNPVDGRWPTSMEARRRALLFPYAIAGIIFCGWALAGLLFGVIRPLMLGVFTVERAAPRLTLGVGGRGRERMR